MAIWPFRRKKKAETTPEPQKVVEESTAAPAASEAEAPESVADTQSASATADAQVEAPELRVAEGVQVLTDYDPINGSTGPFDGDNVNIDDFDFSDFSQAR